MKKNGGCREINLEAGMPTAAQALRLMMQMLTASRASGYAAVKLIHGYGSSGTGGKIRTAARKELAKLREEQKIRFAIPGEKFSIFEPDTLEAFRLCGALRQDRDLDRYNNGVTFVIL